MDQLNTEADLNNALAAQIAEFYDDPLGHVLFSYPWGEPGTTLEQWEGPKIWQQELLLDVADDVRDRGFNGVDPVNAIRYSTASGHGIGKSALVAWLIRWIMDTRPYAKGVVTANSVPQLRTKTWAELAKWHSMGITKHWWILTSGQQLQYYHRNAREQWRCDGQTSKEENSESFAGLHAANSTPFYIFDEASGIPEKIFEVREGGTTDGEPMIFDFGNPTRNTGAFYNNMKGARSRRYNTRSIDSRTVERTGQEELFRQWAEDWGENSDFFKVRVKGEFPDQGDLQFIPTSAFEDCVDLDVYASPSDALVMGVDVARFGSDRSVIWLRRGRDAESDNDWQNQIFQGLDTMQLSSRVAEIAAEKQPDTIFVDGGGVGGGVVDRLRQLGLDVMDINFQGKPTQHGYANLRAQMWGNLRNAMRTGIRLPNPLDHSMLKELQTDICGVEYGFNARNDIQLESKDDMKKRGLMSPDLGDALALTYVLPVLPNRPSFQGDAHEQGKDYDPFD